MNIRGYINMLYVQLDHDTHQRHRWVYNTLQMPLDIFVSFFPSPLRLVNDSPLFEMLKTNRLQPITALWNPSYPAPKTTQRPCRHPPEVSTEAHTVVSAWPC